MKICVLALAHNVFVARVFYREALALHRQGYDVVVYGYGEDNISVQQGEVDGVRFYAYPFRLKRRWKRALSYFRTLPQYFVSAWREDADVYHCHDIQSLLVGIPVAHLRHRKVIYDCHEYQPEADAERFGQRFYPFAKRFFRLLERLMTRLLHGVITVNEDLGARFRRDCDWVVVLPNYPSHDIFLDLQEPPLELCKQYDGNKVLLYVGTISKARGVNACLHMLTHLKKILPDVRMLFIGHFNNEQYESDIHQLVQSLSLEQTVQFLGRVEHEAIPAYLGIGGLGLFLVQPVKERYKWGEPTKFFEYAAAGLPVVMSDLPAKRRLIEEVGNGILVDPFDYQGTAEAIAELLADQESLTLMAKRGRDAFLTKFNSQVVEKRLIDAYTALEPLAK